MNPLLRGPARPSPRRPLLSPLVPKADTQNFSIATKMDGTVQNEGIAVATAGEQA